MPSGTSIRSIWSEKFFPMLMGGFGVLMGFAAFVLLREEREKVDSPYVFLFGLLAAALTSFVIESVRARAEGKDASAQPVSAGRVIGLLILLGLFEIFVIGSESLAKLVVAGRGIEFLNGIFSEGIGSELVSLVQLALFGGLWVLLGAMTAWAAAGAMAASPPDHWRRALVSSMLPMLKGLVLVAGIALLYVCVVRLGYTAYVLAVHPEDYRPGFDLLANVEGSYSSYADMVQFIATGLAGGVETIAHAGRWGGLGVVAAVAGIVVALVFLVFSCWAAQLGAFFNGVLLLGLGGALLLLALGPFATNGRQFNQLVQVGFACAVIWLPPLIVLSVAAPWLRTPSHDPRIWGLVAFGVALILVIVTWERLRHPPDRQFIALFIAGVAFLGFTALLFMHGADLREYWPLVALTMGIATFELGLGLQQLTFLNTFKSFALLQTSQLEADRTRAAGKGYAAVQAWRDDQSIDPAAADLVARAGDIWNADDQPTDRGWLALSIMSRDEPPGPEIARWAHSAAERDYWSRQLQRGLSAETVDALWHLRMRALGGLVALTAAGTIPASSRIRGEAGRLFPLALRETREWRQTAQTLVALGFGSAQVRLRLAELARAEKLGANAEAVRYLELALGASFAFWATAGLLAGSAGRNPVDGTPGRDGSVR